MKKKVLIIFPNEWLAYTPTILNLVARMSDVFDIKVLAIDDGSYSNEAIDSDNFDFIKVNPIALKLHTFTAKRLGTYKVYQLAKMALVFFAARAYKGWADEVIAVDSVGLWIAQKIFGKCHFMSLELFKDRLFNQCDPRLIESVIIQTQERYDYLFGDLAIRTFLIQNSPPCQPSLTNRKFPISKKAIFLGNANPRNGVYFCIEAMRDIEDLSLTVKGTISDEDRKYIETRYSDLLSSGRLIIDDSYVKQELIIEYLSQYYVGFCFYDLSCTDETTRFNFISVPSGKLFNYYAAGVPVVGSNLLGLKSVQDFEAGVLLKEISTSHILQALRYTGEHHDRLSENCLKAAIHFDFNSAVQPFKDYLLTK
jgi:glycosyltransferase involved in cell wall biosynthesis